MFGSTTELSRRSNRATAGVLLGCLLLTACSTGEQSAAGPAADCTALKDLVVLAWADGAGLIPEASSPDRWIDQHPDVAGFATVRTDGEAIDVSRIWTEREPHPDPWNDLVRYYENEGQAWLIDTHLDDIVGSPAGQQPDPVGWSACPDTA